MTMLFVVHVNIDGQLASTCINLHGGSILNDLSVKELSAVRHTYTCCIRLNRANFQMQ